MSVHKAGAVSTGSSHHRDPACTRLSLTPYASSDTALFFFVIPSCDTYQRLCRYYTSLSPAALDVGTSRAGGETETTLRKADLGVTTAVLAVRSRPLWPAPLSAGAVTGVTRRRPSVVTACTLLPRELSSGRTSARPRSPGPDGLGDTKPESDIRVLPLGLALGLVPVKTSA